MSGKERKLKLFVTDMDGTLLQRDFTISPAAVAEITGMEQEGIRFAVATGRIRYDAATICKKHGLYPYIISNNGTCVFEPGGTQIYGAPIDGCILTEIVRCLEREAICYGLGESESYVAPENWVEVLDGEVARLLGEGQKIDADKYRFARSETEQQHGLKTVPDIFAYLKRQNAVYSVSVVTFDGDTIRKVKGIVDACEGITVSVSGPHNMEIMRAKEDKGKALAVLCRHIGIGLEEVAAAGDSLNDLEMVREAGLGIAMGNARTELKEAANLVAEPHTEDGLAKIIHCLIKNANILYTKT